MRKIWETLKIIIEPSSAVAPGVVLKHKLAKKYKHLGIILSGGNLDLNKLPWQ
jgi:threonine dehydratase